MPWCITTGALPTRRRARLIRPLPTSPRPSVSNPKFAKAYSSRGVAYGHKGEHDKAIADFTEAIHLDPKDAEAYFNRGVAYGSKGEHDKAIADFTEAIRLDPKDAQAYANRGFAYENKGEHDKAIADLTEAIRLNPKDAEAYYSRGVAYDAKGRTRQVDRRLHRGHPPEPERRRCLLQPWQRLSEAGQESQGGRRFRPSQETWLQLSGLDNLVNAASPRPGQNRPYCLGRQGSRRRLPRAG